MDCWVRNRINRVTGVTSNVNGGAVQGVYARSRRVNGGRAAAGSSVMGNREQRRQDLRVAFARQARAAARQQGLTGAALRAAAGSEG